MELDRLARALDRDGVAAHQTELSALAGRATAAKLPAGLVAALTDHAGPDVVRLRAFGRVAALLADPSLAEVTHLRPRFAPHPVPVTSPDLVAAAQARLPHRRVA
jgi:hypothetical protein